MFVYYYCLGLCGYLVALRSSGVSSIDFRMVILSAGRCFSHLFVGLHDKDIIQSSLLFVFVVFRVRIARLRFDVLLRGHFPFHRSFVERNDAIGYGQPCEIAV